MTPLTKAEEIEKTLKAFWQLEEFRFIGKYNPHENGKTASFVELRTLNGDLLYYPDDVKNGLRYGIASAFIFPREGLKAGEYYQFTAQINLNEKELLRNPLFVSPQPFGKISMKIDNKIEKEKFIKDLFKRNGSSPRDAKNLASSLRNFQIELYTKTERFVYELLQNADDFPQENKTVTVCFESLTENILITHNGRLFSNRDVESICSIGDSAKTKEISATGYKGIGFKSVFTHSKRVYLNSGGFSFCFDSEYGSYNSFESLYKEAIGDSYYQSKYDEYIGAKNIPWQLKPIWREKYRYPKEVRNKNVFFNSNVGFCLEFGTENINEFNTKIVKLFSEPRFLLFLRNISQIDVKIKNDTISILREIKDDQVILSDFQTKNIYLTYQCPSIDISQIKEEFKNFQDIPPKLLDLPYLTISFASLCKNHEITPISDSVIFTYLPTEDRAYNFPFLVNCDFVTSSNREQIQPDNKWNQFVFENISFQLFNWIAYLVSNRTSFLKSVYNLVPSKFIEDSQIYQAFNRGFEKAIEEIAFIPDYNNQLRRLDEILIDETGLLELLGIEEFRTSVNNEQYPIHTDLQDNETIRRLLHDYSLQNHILGEETMKKWVEHQPDKWFQNIKNNACFLNLLAEKEWLSTFKDWNIFLNQNKKLKKSDEIYDSFGLDLGLLNWLPISYINEEVVKFLNEKVALPIKKYIPISFIKDYILFQKTEVDILLEVESNNRNFYRFLFKHQKDILKEELYKNLKYFKVWGSNNSYISSFSDNIYFYEENLEKLLKANIFPDEQVYMLPQNFFGPPQAFQDWSNFFQKFDVKLYETTTFVKIEIIEKVKKLELHFKNHIAFEEDEPPTESYIQKKSANTQLWLYIHDVLPKFSNEDTKAIKKQLGDLAVFTSEHCITKALKECWLSKSYTDDDTVDGLVNKFPDVANQVTFVSADYLGNYLSQSKWRDLFSGCGGKINEKEFVNLLKDKVGSLSEDNIVEATKFFFKHQDLIENIPINIKLTDGTFTKSSGSIVGKFYTDDDLIETILPSIPIKNLVSEEYLTNIGKKDNWVSFFRKLGVRVLDSEALVIEYKVIHLIENQKEINTPNTTFSHVHALTELHSEKKLSDNHYKKLQGLELLLKYSETNFKPAYECHLSSEYNPKLDLDKLLPDDNKPAIFVSEKYDKKGIGVRSFFRKIGVESSFQVVKRLDQTRAMLLSHNLQDYLNYIDNANFYSNIYKSYSSQHGVYEYQELLYDSFLTQFEVARHFWKDFFPVHQNLISQVKYWVQNKKNYFSIPSPFEYFIKYKPTIPTLGGECNIPNKLFSFRFKDVIEDKNLVCIPELSEIILNNGQSIEKWLGIQQELSLELCLQRIQKISNYWQLEEEGIWDRIRQTSKQGINQSIIAQFHQEGKLPNQLDSWRAIRELFYLEDFDLGIGNSPQIIKQEIADIAAYLSVASLNSNDFKPEYKNNRQDDSLPDVLESKLKFIAFAESQHYWENTCEKLYEIVKPFNFFSVSKIAFCYNKVEPVIENSEKNFHQEEQKIYYVGKWDGLRAVEVFDFLHSVMKLQISLSLFKNILLNDEKEIIEYFEEKNLTIPDQWRTIEPINIEVSIEDKVKIQEKKSATTHNENIDKPYSPIIDKIIKDLDGLNRASQQDYHKEAAQAGLQWLENNSWNLNDTQLNEWGEFENVRYSSSQPYTIIIRSAVAGLLRLNQYSWLHLGQSEYKLLVKTGGGANDFRLYHSQQDLLDDPKNEKNVVVKQNTKNPEVLTNMFEKLEDEDKAHIYFVSNQKGTSIFESLVKSKPSGEAGIADESDLY